MTDEDNIIGYILAGGKGSRLRGMLDGRQKVMAIIGGRPFLYLLLDQLVEADIRQVVLCVGYRSGEVEEQIGSSYRGMAIGYSKETTPMGTGGAFRLAAQRCCSGHCLVMNGDSYLDADLKRFFWQHREADAAVSMLLTEVPDAKRFGTVCVDNAGKISQFIEKIDQHGSALINAGVYILDIDTALSIPEGIPYSLETDYFPSMVGNRLFGFKSHGMFVDIGTPESFVEASNRFGGDSASFIA